MTAPRTLALPTLVKLPGGAFVMGSKTGRPDERPVHEVTLAPFRAAITPVTNAQYAAFVEATGHDAAPFIDDARFSEPEQPAVGMSWFDAVAYCEWLASVTGVRFRLPSEAEREYAARGGVDDCDWPWGDEPPESRAQLSEIVSLERPHVPGPECANGFGLRCMVDNVHEWCSDWYAPAYDAPSPMLRRASRGGSWRHMVKFNRVSARSSLNPEFRYNDYGFRVYASD